VESDMMMITTRILPFSYFLEKFAVKAYNAVAHIQHFSEFRSSHTVVEAFSVLFLLVSSVNVVNIANDSVLGLSVLLLLLLFLFVVVFMRASIMFLSSAG